MFKEYNKNTSFSVAIPTYCRPHWINNTIKNILNQTLHPSELLIIDASTNPDTENVVMKYKKDDVPFDIIYIKNMKGLTKQRNRAIKEFKNDIIVFLDDDLNISIKFFEKLINVFNKDYEKKIGGASGYITNNWGKPNKGRTLKYWTYLGFLNKDKNNAGQISSCGIFMELSYLKQFNGIYKVDFLPGGTTAWRREVFNNNEYPEHIGQAEDKYFSARAGKSWELVIVGDAHVQHLCAAESRAKPFNVGFNHSRNTAIISKEVLKITKINYSKQQIFLIISSIILCISSILSIIIKRIQIHEGINLTKRGIGTIFGAITNIILPQKFQNAINDSFN